MNDVFGTNDPIRLTHDIPLLEALMGGRANVNFNALAHLIKLLIS